MIKILLVNPNYYERVYGRSLIKMAINRGTAPLGIALLRAVAEAAGQAADIFDMNVNDYSAADLLERVRVFRPDIIGFTMTTPLFSLVRDYCRALKDSARHVLLAAGGPHPTALPAETVRGAGLDYVVAGPGDVLFLRLANGDADYRNVWKGEGESAAEGMRPPPEDIRLDDLPYPRYNPEDVPRYIHPPLTSRRNPVANMETSRGCFSRCVFCNKRIFGHRYASKSPRRVVEEMEYFLKTGFREIHIVDDGFSTDPERVIAIGEEILRRGLKFSWYPNGGIRVDRVSAEMFRVMKRAGCYKIPFGVESGSQRVLDAVGKGITLEQVETAVRLAKAAGMETECNFMIGLPTETEDDAVASFEFAKKLGADYMKFAVTIPLPGTGLFADLEARHRILSRDWDRYQYASDPSRICVHDVMPSETIIRLYRKFNKEYYFRLSYVVSRLAGSLRRRTLWSDFKSALALLLS